MIPSCPRWAGGLLLVGAPWARLPLARAGASGCGGEVGLEPCKLGGDLLEGVGQLVHLLASFLVCLATAPEWVGVPGDGCKQDQEPGYPPGGRQPLSSCPPRGAYNELEGWCWC